MAKQGKKKTVIIKDVKVENSKRGNKRKTQTMVSGVSGLTKDLACSVLRPFDCSACIPDGRTNSGCYSIKQDGQLSTGAAGTCCGIAVSPQAEMLSFVDSGSTATTPTIATTWASNQLSVVTGQYRAFRPVSAGLRITFAGATQTDQGTIVVAQLAASSPISNLNATTLAAFSQLASDYRVIPLRNGCEITWRPEDANDQMNFVAYGAANPAVSVAPRFPTIVAWIYGAQSSSIVANYEFVVNMEGQFSNLGYIPGGIQSTGASGNRAEVGWYEKMRNIVDKVVPILPMVGSALSAATGNPLFTTLGSLANGVRYQSQVGKPSRIKL